MLKAITAEPVQVYAAPAYGKEGIRFRITNLDLTNTVYWSSDPGIDAGSSPLREQASSVFDGSQDIWMSTLTGGPVVLVDYAPSSIEFEDPIGVQLALNALGLATAANQVNNQQVAQPHVPGINSRLLQGAGTFSIGQAHRLWAYVFTFSYASNGSYSGSNDVVAQFADPFSTFALCTLEFTILSPSTHETQVCALSLPGINETTGPYGVTFTTPPTNVSLRTNLTILYSIP